MAPRCNNYKLVTLEEGVEAHVAGVVPVHGRGAVAPKATWLDEAWLEKGEEENKPCKSQKRPLLKKSVYPKQKLTLLPKEINNKYLQLQKNHKKLIELLRPPFFVIFITSLMIIVHVCVECEQRYWLEWSPGPWWWQPWRLLSYGIIHSDAKHLSLNVFMAFIISWRLEREQSWWRISVVWVGGLGAGALGVGALQPGVRVVGASAAVYALLTSHIPNVCYRYGSLSLCWFRILAVVVLCLSELSHYFIFWNYFCVDAVAWSSHFMGGTVGLLLGFLIFTGENKHRLFVALCRWASAAAAAALLLAAAYYYTFNYNYYHKGYYRKILR